MSHSRPTMHDVARVAGVSLKTVSRVVNNEPRVNRETTARVQAAIETLGFQRNEFARQLRSKLTATIGLIIEDIANPFYSQIARGAEAVASAHDCVMITVSSEEDPARERDLVRTLIERRVDGLLIVPASADHSYIALEARHGTPVVFVDRPPGKLEADVVLLENRLGAARGVAHLIAQGHSRIAFISGFKTVHTGAERLAGYEDALRAAGIGVAPDLLSFEGHTADHAERTTLEMLGRDHPPTAIFAASNRQSLGVLRALHRSGKSVALVGFDDFEFADVLPFPITVVRYAAAEMGRLAAELLFQRLEGETSLPQRFVVPVELFTRGIADLPSGRKAGQTRARASGVTSKRTK